MAMGRSEAVQDELMATWAEMPRSPGHAFYDRLQELLRESGLMSGEGKRSHWPSASQAALRNAIAQTLG